MLKIISELKKIKQQFLLPSQEFGVINLHNQSRLNPAQYWLAITG